MNRNTDHKQGKKMTVWVSLLLIVIDQVFIFFAFMTEVQLFILKINSVNRWLLWNVYKNL